MAGVGQAVGHFGSTSYYILCQRDLLDDVFPNLSIAADLELNPGFAHVPHDLIVVLAFEDYRVPGGPQSGAQIARQLSVARGLGGPVFEVMEFTLNLLRTRAGHAEGIGIVSAVLTVADYAAGEAADKRGILATLLVLRRGDQHGQYR
jgi:hypothetical protein